MSRLSHDLTVKQGFSRASDEAQAAQEVAEAIDQPGGKLGLVFCSSRYDLDRLQRALGERLSFPLIGCTTAGELSTQRGMTQRSIVAASLGGEGLFAHVQLIDQLDQLDEARGQQLAQELVARVDPARQQAGVFGLLLIDGLAMLEERVAATLFTHMGGIPLVGGSAGDDLSFTQTAVFAEGGVHSNAAVLCLVETDAPFRTFKTQHFQATDQRMVITESDPARRRVLEIDGLPAAEAYAEHLGLSVEELTPSIFSKHPLILRINGESYVRSIQRQEPDGSLVFYCAIDTGLVLSIGRAEGLVEDLSRQLDALAAELGQVTLVIGCDCILRRLETEQRGLCEQVAAQLSRLPFIGFNTYGEQLNALHINQTLTGIALGSVRE